MFFGTQYYRAPFPTKEKWERDFNNIRELGFNTVKLWAVWNDIERLPGHFQFDELDILTMLAKKENLKVIINVIPEGAPYWLIDEFPDSMYETTEGIKIQLSGAPNMPTGGWPGLCMDNPEVEKKVCDFIGAVAEHYAYDDNVVAIDVWNEPHIEPVYFCKEEMLCACKYSKEAFRGWLIRKYGSIEALNATWFRNYTQWSQVTPPVRFGTYPDMMDWRKFWVDNLCVWLNKKVEAARKGAPNKIIQTHVACSAYRGSNGDGSLAKESADEFLIAKEVDMFGLSSFPKWQMGDTKEEYNISHMFHCDAVAAASCEKNFYQVELQGGSGVGFLADKQPDRDDIRVWNWNVIASGGKGVIYWQYAPEPSGQESPGFGLTEVNGENTERSIEAGRIAAFFEELKLDNTKPVKSVNGIYLSRNSDLLAFTAGQYEKEYTDSVFGVYRACIDEGIPVRLVHADNMDKAFAEGLKKLYLPMSISMSEKEQKDILNFVYQGGSIVLEAACGLYSESGAIIRDSLLMKELFGQRTMSLDMAKEDAKIVDSNGANTMLCYKYCQKIRADYGTIEGYFEDNSPAVISAAYGKGKAKWIGSFAALAYERTRNESIRKYIASSFLPYGYSQLTDLKAKKLTVRLIDDKNQYYLIAVNGTSETRNLKFEANNVQFSEKIEPYTGAIYKV